MSRTIFQTCVKFINISDVFGWTTTAGPAVQK
uniref:Uncharacterized protein n=1 Tax=Anguilla anguilla TaxID=7936 RepID=A0A0E9SIM1_ANGAN